MKFFKLKPTPESAIIYMKTIVFLLFSWPLNKDASKLTKIITKLSWWICFFISLFLIIPLCYGAYIQRNDLLAATKSICLAVVCAQYVVKLFICKSQNKRVQILTHEMEKFIKNSKNYERDHMKRYVKNVGFIIVAYNMTALAASLGVICGPIVLDQPLPTDAKYPFSIDKHPVFEIIYILQSIAGLQCCSITFTDGQIAMMIWFVVIRFELLAKEMEKVVSFEDLRNSIKKHQYLLGYADELSKSVRYNVLSSIFMTMLTIIFGAIHIVGKVPLVVKLQFIVVEMGSIVQIFMIAWPAQNLIEACENIGWSLYRTDCTKKFINTAMIVYQRSSKPTVIKVGGLLPTLSLSYYGLFVSKTFSFFTTLRVMLSKMDGNF